MSDLASLRKNLGSTMQRMKEKAESEKSSKPAADSRFYKIPFDKEKGTGGCVLRPLPAPSGESDPFVRVYSHSFRGSNGKYYIENSLSTIGKRDAVGSLGYRLYNSGVESDKIVQKSMKRRAKFYANFLVVNDPSNPENNGRVVLLEYGPQLHQIIEAAMFPPSDDIDPKDPINVFDPWEGADLVIRAYGKTIPGNDGKMILVPSYEKSSFKAPSCVGDDEYIDSVWKKTHSIQEFIDPKNFKSEDELKKRLIEVLGLSVGSGIAVVEGWSAPVEQPKQERAEPKEQFADVPPFDVDEPKQSKQVQKKAVPPITEDDDDISFLKGLMD
jgi:hypothetical protein